MNNNCIFASIAGACAVVASSPAYAAIFDLMQIEQVIGGVNGDTTAQAIQLRMRSDFQCFVSLSRVWVHDAAGENPVLLIDIDSDLPGCSTGDRVLIASANFADFLDGPAPSDFTLTNLIPESYLAAGSITFEDDFGPIFWRLSWGGDDYTGDTTGLIINDDDGDFGPPWPGPLPTEGAQALLFQGSATAGSTTNADDYALTERPAVFTNNAGQSATVTGAPACPWDCGGDNDDNVGIVDFLALLAQWGMVDATCDFGLGAPGVGIEDFLQLLGNWGPCP